MKATAVLIVLFYVIIAEGQKVITVSKDGKGQFTTVQAAVNSIPDNNANWIEISVAKGTYNEHVSISTNKSFIRLIGESPSNTIITAANIQTNGSVPLDTATVTLYNNDFYAENIAFENTHGSGVQALALGITGFRLQFKNCYMSGYQDTMYLHSGMQYFENCTIAGATDFIYGGANAVFENCNIHAVAAGYLTAAKTPETQEFGLTFLNCDLTAGSNVAAGSVYLGRTWGPYAKVDYLYCDEGSHINALGWNNMGYPAYQPTVRLAEYNCTGPGSSTKGRVSWSSQLSSSDAKEYTVANILAGWTPSK